MNYSSNQYFIYKFIFIFNNITNENKIEENNANLNVEEILMIEEKLSSLINCLIDCNPCIDECFKRLNFYFTTKLSRNICNYFLRENYLKIITKKIILKYLLLFFVMIYH